MQFTMLRSSLQQAQSRAEKKQKSADKAKSTFPLPETSTEPPLRRLSPIMGLKAGEEALRYAVDFDQNSQLAKRTRRRRKVSQLRWSEIQVGKLLGEGNFSHVYEVKLQMPLLDETESVRTTCSKKTIENDVWKKKISSWYDDDDANDIWDMISKGGNVGEDLVSDEDEGDEELMEATYALKHLHPQVTMKQRDFTASAIDLVLEAKLLGCLDHPNIVKIFGVTEGSVSTVFQTKGYFLLLDRLHGTLDDKIQEWKFLEESREFSNVTGRRASLSLSTSHRRHFTVNVSRRASNSDMPSAADQLGGSYNDADRMKLVEERLARVALDITNGMEYLHKHKIIFRDLKPSNIGFTLQGEAKIFDFGLAREIIDSDRRMTGNTGSLRYMAPEVNRREHYHLSADVYSFGVLLWEMCSLQKPFVGMSKEDHSDLVIHKGFRPKISAVPGSAELKDLIQSCWAPDAKYRPTFTHIRQFLIAQSNSLKRVEELAAMEIHKEPVALKWKLTKQQQRAGSKEKGRRLSSGLLALAFSNKKKL